MTSLSIKSFCSPVLLRDHAFDLPERANRKPKRKRGEINLPGKVAQGVRSVRQHHRCDESKLLPHVRLGININCDDGRWMKKPSVGCGNESKLAVRMHYVFCISAWSALSCLLIWSRLCELSISLQSYRWVSARKTYLQCVSNGITLSCTNHRFVYIHQNKQFTPCPTSIKAQSSISINQ